MSCLPVDLPAGTILVAAPHMDDEVLACGGLIAQLDDPSRVHVVYATDGMKSPAPIIPGRDRITADLGQRPCEESVAAMGLLGVPAGNLHFLDLPEAELPLHEPELARRLVDWIRDLAPAVVLVATGALSWLLLTVSFALPWYVRAVRVNAQPRPAGPPPEYPPNIWPLWYGGRGAQHRRELPQPQEVLRRQPELRLGPGRLGRLHRGAQAPQARRADRHQRHAQARRGPYGTEISALLGSNAEIIQNSLWGGDLEAYIMKAGPRGLMAKMPNIMITGETVIDRLRKDLPDGTILGARGPNGPFAPPTALNKWFASLQGEVRYPGGVRLVPHGYRILRHQSRVREGAGGQYESSCRLVRCSFSWATTGSGISHNSSLAELIDCDMSPGSTHPSTLFTAFNRGAVLRMTGCDLSDSSTVFATTPAGVFFGTLERCKLKASATIWAPSAPGSGEVYVFDCASGDTHYVMEHYSYLGTTKVTTAYYANDHICDAGLS